VPQADSCTAAKTFTGCIDSLDHLVGAGKQRWRDRQAERRRGLEIDDDLELIGLLDRQLPKLARELVDMRYPGTFLNSASWTDQ
jgi:hypothetical protein